MNKKTFALTAAIFAATLSLSACDQVSEQLPQVDVNGTIEKLDQMAKDGVDIRVPSAGEIETMAKDTVCPALKRDSSNQTFKAVVSHLEREFGLTPESADLVAATGAQIWCPAEYEAVEGK
ncbi:hypothetical protein [Micrococcoides hystricis]|uniref:DUF732 domain-containing protein n=1 Tax=Micrococcoides hystricis TaxID=1572761 RepID=A0ABV6PBK8_9MICC